MADYRQMTEAEKQEILYLYQTKVDEQWPTIEEVAKRSGRSPSTVGRLVRAAGISHARKNRVTDAEVDRILELHRARNGPRRTTVAEIGRMVKRHPQTVARVIANHKTGTVSHTKTTKKRHKPSRAQTRRKAISEATAPPSAGHRPDQVEPKELTTKPSRATTKPECVGTCSYACTKLCAISAQVGNRAQPPGSPSPCSNGSRREPGIPYVRTGLKLPSPGERSRFSP